MFTSYNLIISSIVRSLIVSVCDELPHCATRNSSGDELANVNFLRRHHTLIHFYAVHARKLLNWVK